MILWLRLALVLLALAGTGFFLLRRRRFDWYAISFFGSLAYFLPGFAGFVRLPKTVVARAEESVGLAPEAYGVMIAVLGVTLLAGIAYDAAALGSYRPQFVLTASSRVGAVALAVSLLALGGTLAGTGTAAFTSTKADLMPVLGRAHVLYVNSAMVGAVFAWVTRNRALGMGFLALLVFDLYLGYRVWLAMSALAVVTLALSSSGPTRLGTRLKAIGAGLGVASFFFLVKRLLGPIRAARWDVVWERMTTPQDYVLAFVQSEPFKTQAILNEAVVTDLKLGLEMYQGLIGLLLFRASDLGVRGYAFGDLVMDELFPGALAGMASNIWAETWSIGRWSLLVVGLCAWAAILGLLSVFLSARDPLVRAVAAVLGAYWAFYLHRNDLMYQLLLSRRVVLVAAICWGCAAVLSRRGARPVAS